MARTRKPKDEPGAPEPHPPGFGEEGGILGDLSSKDIGEGLHIDPRLHLEPDFDLKNTKMVTDACGRLSGLVAYKVLFEALYLGFAMVPQKILMKAMDQYMPVPTDAKGTSGSPIFVNLQGVDINRV